MTKTNNTTILMKIDFVLSDRTQYKPYMAQLSGGERDIYVAIPIESKDVLQATDKTTIITLEGLATIMGTIADEIEEMNDAHNDKRFKLSTR